MKNSYGLDTKGVLVSVDSVERGLACNCLCPACGHRLEAHRGASRRAYFSHYRGGDCGRGYETARHILAKEIIADEERLLLPELVAESDRSIAIDARLVHPASTADSVPLRLPKCRPLWRGS